MALEPVPCGCTLDEENRPLRICDTHNEWLALLNDARQVLSPYDYTPDVEAIERVRYCIGDLLDKAWPRYTDEDDEVLRGAQQIMGDTIDMFKE